MLAVAEMITLSTDMAGDLYYLTMSVNKVEVVNIAIWIWIRSRGQIFKTLSVMNCKTSALGTSSMT